MYIFNSFFSSTSPSHHILHFTEILCKSMSYTPIYIIALSPVQQIKLNQNTPPQQAASVTIFTILIQCFRLRAFTRMFLRSNSHFKHGKIKFLLICWVCRISLFKVVKIVARFLPLNLPIYESYTLIPSIFNVIYTFLS